METLHIPFHTVTKVVGSSINNTQISIALILAIPPIIGEKPLSLPSGGALSVSWRLKKSQLDKFVNVAKNRNLVGSYILTSFSTRENLWVDFLELDKKKIPSWNSNCIRPSRRQATSSTSVYTSFVSFL